MVAPYVEAANACVGIAVGIAFIVTFSVAAANGGFVNMDDTGADNATLANLHYAADTVTDELSALDIDVDAYGPAIKVGCQLAKTQTGVGCPHKISGVAVGSIVTGVLAVLALLLGLYFRHERRSKSVRRRHARLYPDL